MAKAVNLREMDQALTTLLKTFPNVNPQLVSYVDNNTINRGNEGFDFYSWSYWGMKSDGRSSISAMVTDTYNKFNRFSDKMQTLKIGEIEKTLPAELTLKQGSKFRYAGDKKKDNMTGQDFTVISLQRVGDSVIVYYMPERTPVRNHSMFHYGLFTDYKVTKY